MWALLPLKNFTGAKQRLSGLLTPMERRNLFQAMVEDVLSVLSKHPELQGTLLVSDDPTAKLLAKHYQVEHLAESSLAASGLNGVVQAAVTVLSGRGIDEVMVIHGDLPLINAAEITRLIRAHRRAPVPALTIAPDRHHDGSNCLLCTPASAIRYCYGADSFRKHSEQAETIGASLQVLDLPGASCDIDWPEDLLHMLNRAEWSVGKRALAYLSDSGLIERLEVMGLDSASINSNALEQAG